jgi:hypothetical protein
MTFKRAVKHNIKLRMSISGVPGGGKSWTMLTILEALAHGAPVAVLDSEHDSALKYADSFIFDHQSLDGSFSLLRYIDKIKEAEAAEYQYLGIDGISHAWVGAGGALEQVDSVAKRVQAARGKKEPNTFNAWSEVTPVQNQFIDTILSSPMHIIVTMRSKMDYVVDQFGKATKVGIEPIQRGGVEYEFDICADMDTENTMIIQKSRCRALNGQVIPKPDSRVAKVIEDWLVGDPTLEEFDAQQLAMKRLLTDFYSTNPLYFSQISDWREKALSKGLGIAIPELPAEFSPEHLEKMRSYVLQRQREVEEKKAADATREAALKKQQGK